MVSFMSSDKVKTTIVVDRKIWEAFKAKIALERGLRDLSKAVEDALREELCELMVVEMLSEYLKESGLKTTVNPVKPRIPSDSGMIVREIRDEAS